MLSTLPSLKFTFPLPTQTEDTGHDLGQSQVTKSKQRRNVHRKLLFLSFKSFLCFVVNKYILKASAIRKE